MVFLMGKVTPVLGDFHISLDQQIQDFVQETNPEERYRKQREIAQRIKNMEEDIRRRAESRRRTEGFDYDEMDRQEMDERRQIQVTPETFRQFYSGIQTSDYGSRSSADFYFYKISDVVSKSPASEEDKTSFYTFISREKDYPNITSEIYKINREAIMAEEISTFGSADINAEFGYQTSMVAEAKMFKKLIQEGRIKDDGLGAYGEELRSLLDDFDKTKDQGGLTAVFEKWKKEREEKEKKRQEEGRQKQHCPDPSAHNTQNIENMANNVGEISEKMKKGDFNGDGVVDKEDLDMLKRGLSLVRKMREFQIEYEKLSKESDEKTPDKLDAIFQKAQDQWREKAPEVAFADLNKDWKFNEDDIKAMEKFVSNPQKAKKENVEIREYHLLMDSRKDDPRYGPINPIRMPWKSVLTGPQTTKAINKNNVSPPKK